jgi:hypothetical protein
MRVPRPLVLAVVVVLVALAGLVGRADGQTTRVLDRTYSCRVELGGGLSAVDVIAHAGSRSGSMWAKLPYVGIRSGNATISTGNLLGWVSAGRPSASSTMDLDFWSFGGLGTVGVRRPACRATTAAVSLSPSGLRGGSAPATGSSFTCEAPRRILLRVRAQLVAPAVQRGREFSTVHAAARSAQVAVRTERGRPLAYGDVHESGRARLFVAKGCFPD